MSPHSKLEFVHVHESGMCTMVQVATCTYIHKAYLAAVVLKHCAAVPFLPVNLTLLGPTVQELRLVLSWPGFLWDWLFLHRRSVGLASSWTLNYHGKKGTVALFAFATTLFLGLAFLGLASSWSGFFLDWLRIFLDWLRIILPWLRFFLDSVRLSEFLSPRMSFGSSSI